jgi:hypothetical protein
MIRKNDKDLLGKEEEGKEGHAYDVRGMRVCFSDFVVFWFVLSISHHQPPTSNHQPATSNHSHTAHLFS